MSTQENFDNVLSQPVRSKRPLCYGLMSLRDVLKIGHCAPSVMRTLLRIRGVEDGHVMMQVSGMGGGIGLSEAECGGVTSSISTLGLMFGDKTDDNGMPMVIAVGQSYLDRFAATNGSVLCEKITPDKSTFRPCIKAMCSAPRLLMTLVDKQSSAFVPASDGEAVAANQELLKHFSDCNFHCAHTVLKELVDVIDVDDELLRSSYGFIGGTVLKGMTCGALVAGVHAIGLKFGGTEESYLRVLKLMGLFKFSPDNAMKEDVNKANRAMNTSYNLTLRFEEEFSSTMCDIVQADFSSKADLDKYLSENTMDKCVQITKFVAECVREIIYEDIVQAGPVKTWTGGKS